MAPVAAEAEAAMVELEATVTPLAEEWEQMVESVEVV